MNEKLPMSFLVSARVPRDEAVLRAVTVGIDKISRFYSNHYFKSYIKNGGSAVRFITGKHGSGKSHLLALLEAEAGDAGYFVFSGSADAVLLSDFSLLYKAVLSKACIDALITSAAQCILNDLGFNGYTVSQDKKVLDQMAERGELDSITRAEIKTEVRKRFNNTPDFDNNFGLCCSMLVCEKIGLIDIGEESVKNITQWLSAESCLTIPQLRAEGLLPYKISKTNARRIIRSFAQLVRMAGYSGLYISIDNLDSLLSNNSLSEVHYTKMRRDDAYEAIRQIIDDTDNSKFIFYAFAFSRELIDDEKAGLSSYQALWMRMQNEISSSRINYFQSMLDLDKANSQLMTPDSLVELSQKISDMTDGLGICSHVISRDEAKEIINKANFGSASLPLLVNRATIQIEAKEAENDTV